MATLKDLMGNGSLGGGLKQTTVSDLRSKMLRDAVVGSVNALRDLRKELKEAATEIEKIAIQKKIAKAKVAQDIIIPATKKAATKKMQLGALEALDKLTPEQVKLQRQTTEQLIDLTDLEFTYGEAMALTVGIENDKVGLIKKEIQNYQRLADVHDVYNKKTDKGTLATAGMRKATQLLTKQPVAAVLKKIGQVEEELTEQKAKGIEATIEDIAEIKEQESELMKLQRIMQLMTERNYSYAKAEAKATKEMEKFNAKLEGQHPLWEKAKGFMEDYGLELTATALLMSGLKTAGDNMTKGLEDMIAQGRDVQADWENGFSTGGKALLHQEKLWMDMSVTALTTGKTLEEVGEIAAEVQQKLRLDPNDINSWSKYNDQVARYSRITGLEATTIIEQMRLGQQKFGGTIVEQQANLMELKGSVSKLNTEYGVGFIRLKDVVQASQELSQNSTALYQDTGLLNTALVRQVERLREMGVSYDEALKNAKGFVEGLQKPPEWAKVLSGRSMLNQLQKDILDPASTLMEDLKVQIGEDGARAVRKTLDDAKAGLIGSFTAAKMLSEQLSGTEVGMTAVAKALGPVVAGAEGAAVLEKEFNMGTVEAENFRSVIMGIQKAGSFKEYNKDLVDQTKLLRNLSQKELQRYMGVTEAEASAAKSKFAEIDKLENESDNKKRITAEEAEKRRKDAVKGFQDSAKLQRKNYEEQNGLIKFRAKAEEKLKEDNKLANLTQEQRTKLIEETAKAMMKETKETEKQSGLMKMFAMRAGTINTAFKAFQGSAFGQLAVGSGAGIAALLKAKGQMAMLGFLKQIAHNTSGGRFGGGGGNVPGISGGVGRKRGWRRGLGMATGAGSVIAGMAGMGDIADVLSMIPGLGGGGGDDSSGTDLPTKRIGANAKKKAAAKAEKAAAKKLAGKTAFKSVGKFAAKYGKYGKMGLRAGKVAGRFAGPVAAVASAALTSYELTSYLGEKSGAFAWAGKKVANLMGKGEKSKEQIDAEIKAIYAEAAKKKQMAAPPLAKAATATTATTAKTGGQPSAMQQGQPTDLGAGMFGIPIMLTLNFAQITAAGQKQLTTAQA